MKDHNCPEEDDPYRPSAPIPTGTIPRWVRRHYQSHAVEFDENEAAPSAPPLNLMDQVSGYETVSFDAVSVPPPVAGAGAGAGADASDSEPSQRERVELAQGLLSPVSELEARAALLAHVKRHCCYGVTAARNMAIVSLNHSSAFQYTLETFTEKRETAWSYCPYLGDDVDGADNGPAPLPWDLEISPSQPFSSEVKCQPVPHTASIKQCHRCKGSCSIQCTDCHGKGWIHCISCHGNGYDTDAPGYKERCFYCHSSIHGRGRQDCVKCGSKGKMTCPTCEGGGSLLCFIQLTVTWKVNSSEHIVDRMSVPEDLVRSVSGVIAVLEEGPRVLPIVNFPDETINMASAQLLRDHERSFVNHKTLAQRHKVQVIPVTCASYRWKDRKGEFYVYGNEHKVYAPDYPQTCCCGCTIV